MGKLLEKRIFILTPLELQVLPKTKLTILKRRKGSPDTLNFLTSHIRRRMELTPRTNEYAMEFAKQKMDEYRASGKFPNEYAIQREAWEFCMGEDAPGRARGFGVGVTKSQVCGFRVELMQMRNEGLTFDHSRSMEDQLRKELAAYKACTDATIKAMQAELQLYRTAFVSGVDPMSQAYDQIHGGGASHQQ